MNFEELISIYSFTANILLSLDLETSKQIIDVLLCVLLSANNIQNEAEEFVGHILNSMALKLVDEWNVDPVSASYTLHFNNFWDLWEYLFVILKNKPSNLFSNKLLLDIPHLCYDSLGRPYKKQCELVKHKKKIYGEMVSVFGTGNLLTIIKIFTNIGMPSLFPDCINWICDICKKAEYETWVLATDISITMVKKLFHQYMMDIAQNESILNNYIWLLDKMIDLGVSEAYFLRENVITFKPIKNHPIDY